MNVYEIKHDGHYLGGCSIVVAESEGEAIKLMKIAVQDHGLVGKVDHVRKLRVDRPFCYVIDDGDY